MSPAMREHILRLAQDGFDNPERGQDMWEDAEAVLAWLDATEPPPNTHTVRVTVDVSPLYPNGKRQTFVTLINESPDDPLKYLHAHEGGWKRSIGIIHAPVPGPIAEIVGVLEVV